MITEINIKNFKSIVDLTLPLSNINVFIGENGCGKTNILEAVGFPRGTLDIAVAHAMGIRAAKPSLIFNAFSSEKKTLKETTIRFKTQHTGLTYKLEPIEEHENFFKWIWHSAQDFMPNADKLDAGLREIIQMESIECLVLPTEYLIYTLNTTALRGLSNDSLKEPLGINGENLDVLLASFDNGNLALLKEKMRFISWVEDVMIDKNDELKFNGYKLGRGRSRLFFTDKYLSPKNNFFSAENTNEGILHILFYLALFISNKTPKMFAIDNIETALNPKLCRSLMKILSQIAIDKGKQALITTHNPAVLDGLNLHDDRQRLFVVKRNDEGHTQIERIRLKPNVEGEHLKLSEMWMRGHLGAIPNHF